MRLLITGLNGTLAPKVATAAAHRGWQVSGWDRHRFPPDNISACHTFLAETKPDAIMRLAMGSEIWAELQAAYAAAHRLPFVFTSSAMDERGHKDVPADILVPRESESPAGREVESHPRRRARDRR